MLETPKAAPLVPTENEADVTVDNKQATPQEIAYVAGLMDGEGCIAIQSQKLANGKVGYAVNVKITNTDPNIIERIQSTYLKLGINPLIRERDNSKNPQWKNWFEVYLTKQSQIQRLLETLLPYLVGKRARATMMLRYITKQICKEEAFHEMKRMNAKGESSETTREAPSVTTDEDIVQAA